MTTFDPWSQLIGGASIVYYDPAQICRAMPEEVIRGRWNASGVISAGHSGGSGGNDRQPSSMHLTRLAPVTPLPSLINKDEKKQKQKKTVRPCLHALPPWVV